MAFVGIAFVMRAAKSKVLLAHALRVRFSNQFGSAPLRIAAASVARRSDGAAIVASSLRRLTFSGAAGTTIPRGGIVVSDPVELVVAEQADLAISLYIADAAVADTALVMAHQTSYVSSAGDFTASASFGPARTMTSWCWLSGVEILSNKAAGAALVALGDSVTEGYGSTTDANARWPDVLARWASTAAASCR
jgi:hypothetical protein